MPARRKSRRPPRRSRWSWLARLILAASGAAFAVTGWAILTRWLAPTANTPLTRFDAIVVLGYPADSDGNPSPEQQARVTEAVREYNRGVAPRLILSGGAVRNRFVEARVMARIAESEAIPEAAIFVEPQASNTIENACYAERIMRAHGWRSAEVVSSPYHLPRAGIIFSHLPLAWHTHAAPPLSPQPAAAIEALETAKMVHYLLWSRWTDRCEP